MTDSERDPIGSEQNLVGLLAPYLSSEQATQLAMGVVSALAPNKVPRSAEALKRFGEMINCIALQAEPRQRQIQYALLAWPYSFALEKPNCFAAAALFPERLPVDEYSFCALKNYSDFLIRGVGTSFLNSIANGGTVFSVLAVDEALPVATLALSFTFNLARPLDPSRWCTNEIIVSPRCASARVMGVAERLCLIADRDCRPYD